MQTSHFSKDYMENKYYMLDIFFLFFGENWACVGLISHLETNNFATKLNIKKTLQILTIFFSLEYFHHLLSSYHVTNLTNFTHLTNFTNFLLEGIPSSVLQTLQTLQTLQMNEIFKVCKSFQDQSITISVVQFVVRI